MAIYFILYILIGLTAGFINNLKENNSKKRFLTCLITFILLVLLFSLRHPSMGVDLQYGGTTGYLSQFHKIANLEFKDVFSTSILNYELGFVLFNKLISYISIDFQFYLFSCAFCALLPIAYIIFRYSKSPFFSFIVYLGLPVFLMLFSGMRQILAIAICCFSLKFIYEKKLIKFILSVAIASFFHYSAIVFFISYPIFHIKLNKAIRISTLIIIALVFIFRTKIFFIVSKVLKDEAEINYNDSIGLFLVFLLIYIYCFIFSKEDSENNGLLNLFFLACLIQAFSGIYATAMRVGYYFMISLFLLLPKTVLEIEDNRIKYTSLLFINIAFIVFGLWSIYNSSWAMAYPYYFFWGMV